MNAQKHQAKTLQALDHATRYYDIGSGKPLILLHGSGPGVSGYTNFAPVMDDFAEDFRVIVPDIAGFGFTEFKDGTHYDIKLWVAHMKAIMDALDIEKASFLGNSFGGAVSIGMALFHPERVEKLILLGTPAGTFEQTPGLRSAWTYEPSPENMRQVMSLFPYDQSIITDQMVQSRFEASARPGAQDALRKLIPKPNEDGPTMVKGFPEKAVANIQAPTLVVHGREDKVVPPQCGQLLANAMPNADLYLFSRCGHWVQVERRDTFLPVAKQFLEA